MSIIKATFQVCYERQPHLCSIPWGIFIGIVTIIILKKKNEIKKFITYFINYNKNTSSNTTSTSTSKENKSTMSSIQNITDMMSKLYGIQSFEFLTATAIKAQQLQIACRNGDELTENQLLLLSKNPAFAKMNGGRPPFLKFCNLIENLCDFNLYYESNPGAMKNGMLGGEATGFGNLFIDDLINLLCNDELRSLIGKFVQAKALVISKLEFDFVSKALESNAFSPEEIRFLKIYQTLLSSPIYRKIGLRCQAYEMNEKGEPVACYSFAVAHCQTTFLFNPEEVVSLVGMEDAQFYFDSMNSVVEKHVNEKGYAGKYHFIY